MTDADKEVVIGLRRRIRAQFHLLWGKAREGVYAREVAREWHELDLNLSSYHSAVDKLLFRQRSTDQD